MADVFVRRNTICFMLALWSMSGRPAVAEQCPGMRQWLTMCCEDAAVGCFSRTLLHVHLPLPCCLAEADGDVTFALYTRSNRGTAVMVRRHHTIPAEFSHNRPTVFLIHGWFSAGTDEEFVVMKDKLLEKGDFNIIVLSWKFKYYYPQSASEIRVVGKITSLLMKTLVEAGSTSFTDIWCIGHSLGAHACGFAGRNTPHKIARITGLDPAGPLFEFIPDVKVGLNAEDAKFVDVIHTDTRSIGNLGTVRAIGHMDFYVNAVGDRQPNCWNRRRRRDASRMLACSHMRAVDFFTESISTDHCFTSRHNCTDIYDMPGSCGPCVDAPGGVCALMGFSAQGSGDNGIFYLETSEDFPPHCKG